MDLGNISVVDLTQLLPGPYATQLLTDMGADVMKVEPLDGDPARHMAITGEQEGALFDMVNQGKRSVALDLKTDGGRECFLALAAEADVVIEQFRPGVVSRLGVDYETVRERNPETIYCSLSGYGQTGSARDRVGHDLNYVATAGLLDMTRQSPDNRPVMPGFPIADMAGGMFAAMSIVSALLSRELGDTGGEYIDVSMTDVTLSLSQVVAAEALSDGNVRPGKTTLTGDLPCYNIYETSDGQYVTLAALEPRFWETFCRTVDRVDLVEFHFAEEPSIQRELEKELTELFNSKSAAEWEDLLGDEETMFAKVNTVTEILESQLMHDRDMVLEGDVDIPSRMGFPAHSSNNIPVSHHASPRLGEHTEEVLREHSVGNERLSELRRDGVF